MDCLFETKMSVSAGKESLVKERKTKKRSNATEVARETPEREEDEAWRLFVVPSPCCRWPSLQSRALTAARAMRAVDWRSGRE